MGLLDKVKNLFTEEEEVYEEPIKKEVIKVEIPAPEVTKEEVEIKKEVVKPEVVKENIEVKKEEPKKPAPVFFDDKDFESIERRTPKPEPKPEEKPTENQEPTTAPSETPDANGQDTETDVPEQPTSTDTGLTVEEYNAIIAKGEQTVELAKNTIKKFGISIPMPSKLYDVLKVVATTVLPLISFVYLGLANIWGLGFGEQVDSTVQLIIAAINTILGAAIIKSSSDYHKGDIK